MLSEILLFLMGLFYAPTGSDEPPEKPIIVTGTPKQKEITDWDPTAIPDSTYVVIKKTRNTLLDRTPPQ